MLNVNIATTVTEILAASTDRRGWVVLIQNQSDTTMRLAFGDANIQSLSSTLGFQLEAGESVQLEEATVMRRVCAIHGGSGSKVAHWQRV